MLFLVVAALLWAAPSEANDSIARLLGTGVGENCEDCVNCDGRSSGVLCACGLIWRSFRTWESSTA